MQPTKAEHSTLFSYFLCYKYISLLFNFQFVNYYDFKENNPEFFDGVNLKSLLRIGCDDIITVPPYREQTGRRILLYRIGKHYSILLVSKLLVMSNDGLNNLAKIA